MPEIKKIGDIMLYFDVDSLRILMADPINGKLFIETLCNEYNTYSYQKNNQTYTRLGLVVEEFRREDNKKIK